MGKIILSADGTCDLPEELRERYDVHFFNYHINIGDESFIDREELSVQEIFAAWYERGILPKTAASSPEDYRKYFVPLLEDGCEIIHFNLGSALSSSHNNCCMTANELGNIRVIDSATLSTGTALLVIKAAEMIEKGMSAQQVVDEIMAMRHKTEASFVLNTVEFLRAGGRCSALMAFGANMLKIKPEIIVDNQKGAAMSVGKKYRGDIRRVLATYVSDRLKDRDDIDTSVVFVTQAACPQQDVDMVIEEVKKYQNFDKIYVATASGTISAHCGPRTLGLLYMLK